MAEFATVAEKRIAFLFPGSFSPITNAHKQSIIELIKYGIDTLKAGHVTVYIIPATNQYNKDSIYLDKSINPQKKEYLSQEYRQEFIETAIKEVMRELTEPYVGKFSVICSDIDYNYGAGKYNVGTTDVTKPSSGLMPTSFLALNYNKPVKGFDGDEKPLIDGFDSNETFLILGADNAYTDIVGWGDPLSILMSVKILVISRGGTTPNKERPIKLYYENPDTNKGSFVEVSVNEKITYTMKYDDALADRNAKYLEKMKKDNDLKIRVNAILGTNPDPLSFNLEELMAKQYAVLEFEIPEISSSLLRKFVLGDEVINQKDITELNRIMVALKKNDDSVKNDYVLNDFDGDQKETNIKQIVKRLSPILYDNLKSAYANGGVFPSATSTSAGGAKTRRRKSRKTKKRRSLRKRNRIHKKR